MWFRGAYIAAMHGGDKDRATGVLSLTNEEPLVIVKSCIDVMWEIVREDGGDSRGSMVWEGEAALCRGGYRGIHEGSFGAEDGDIGRDWGSGSRRGSEVFTLRGGNKDVVGVNGDVLVKRGEEESIEYFLGYVGRCGRHGR
jgi:hypothetical protein